MKQQQAQQQKADRAELLKLRKKYEIARKIVTPEGFYQMYFQYLKKYETNIEAFNALNKLHYNTVLPPRYKYSSYQAFCHAINRMNKKKK